MRRLKLSNLRHVPVVLVLVLVLAVVVASGGVGCSDGSDDGSPDAGSLDDRDDRAAAPDAGTGSTTAPALESWTADWIAAYDRQIAATCPCFVGPDQFASMEDCMAALGSGPTWLECSTKAVANADAGNAIDEAEARCLIDSTNARAACLEQAACGSTAMSDCLSMTEQADACPPLDNDLVVLLLEQCPDLGLLSR